jgi:hypothetical protein
MKGLHCTYCNRFFHTNHNSKIYCSTYCRSRAAYIRTLEKSNPVRARNIKKIDLRNVSRSKVANQRHSSQINGSHRFPNSRQEIRQYNAAKRRNIKPQSKQKINLPSPTARTRYIARKGDRAELPPVEKTGFKRRTIQVSFPTVEHFESESTHAYYQSKRWAERRAKALKRAEWKCQLCSSHSGPLIVHHRTYERFGHERLADLFVICADCHDLFHTHRRLVGQQFSEL